MKNKQVFISSKNLILIFLITLSGFMLYYIGLRNLNHNSFSEKSIVVVIPSYNNIKWYKRNLGMLIKQDKFYKNWRAIYIDDCSEDGTGNAVEKFIQSNNFEHKIKLIRNQINKGALENQYNAIHTCNNSDIIIILDGDDWLKDEQVLSFINRVYQDKNIWMTYGQYEEYPSGRMGLCSQIPQEVTNHNAFRQYKWLSSHLRTFYAGLFKRINKADLLYNDKFYAMTCDLATMFPMLEMAGDHAKFINKVLYVYNQDNPINDWKKDLNLVLHLDHFIRSQPKYHKIADLKFANL